MQLNWINESDLHLIQNPVEQSQEAANEWSLPENTLETNGFYVEKASTDKNKETVSLIRLQ